MKNIERNPFRIAWRNPFGNSQRNSYMFPWFREVSMKENSEKILKVAESLRKNPETNPWISWRDPGRNPCRNSEITPGRNFKSNDKEFLVKMARNHNEDSGETYERIPLGISEQILKKIREKISQQIPVAEIPEKKIIGGIPVP